MADHWHDFADALDLLASLDDCDPGNALVRLLDVQPPSLPPCPEEAP